MKYYVYIHSHNGVIFYVGSNYLTGNKERAYDFRKSQRTPSWNKFASEINYEIEVTIVQVFEDPTKAKAYEIKLIQELHDIGQAQCSHEDRRGELNGMFNKNHSEESRRKMSKAKAGKRRPDKVVGVYQLDPLTQEIIDEFDTTRDAAERTGVSQGSVVISCNQNKVVKNHFMFYYIRDYQKGLIE